MGHKPVISDRKCHTCGLYWCKNFQYMRDGSKRHNGYYHRCGASESGRFDGNGPFVRVGHDMEPNGWTERMGCSQPKLANREETAAPKKGEKRLAKAS